MDTNSEVFAACVHDLAYQDACRLTARVAELEAALRLCVKELGAYEPRGTGDERYPSCIAFALDHARAALAKCGGAS